MLVNVTNDAWFGKAGARYQHFQIARMRAIESQRYLLRAANDGISAIIGPAARYVGYGAAIPAAPSCAAGPMPRSGATPYLTTGNWPVVGGGALVLVVLCLAAAPPPPAPRCGGLILPPRGRYMPGDPAAEPSMRDAGLSGRLSLWRGSYE